jgi:putative endonuclease
VTGVRPRVDRQQLGQAAEDAAARFLQSQQLNILVRNYRCRMGELDLVALDAAGTLVIAEVRLRSRTHYGSGAASVDHRKQCRLIRASRHLLATRPQLARCAVRFDVLDLRPDADNGYRIEWIRHAFTC